jgi:hypothetical protein
MNLTQMLPRPDMKTKKSSNKKFDDSRSDYSDKTKNKYANKKDPRDDKDRPKNYIKKDPRNKDEYINVRDKIDSKDTRDKPKNYINVRDKIDKLRRSIDRNKDKIKEKEKPKDKPKEKIKETPKEKPKDKIRDKTKDRSKDKTRDRTRDKTNMNNVVKLSETGHLNIMNGNTENQGFLFIYEANGVFYSKLTDIPKADGRLIVIHPVYYAGYNNNMFSEEVTYDGSQDKYAPKTTDGSWLDVIYNYPDSVFVIDKKEIVYHDELYFHCNDDLLHYLMEGQDVNTITLL